MSGVNDFSFRIGTVNGTGSASANGLLMQAMRGGELERLRELDHFRSSLADCKSNVRRRAQLERGQASLARRGGDDRVPDREHELLAGHAHALPRQPLRCQREDRQGSSCSADGCAGRPGTSAAIRHRHS